MAKKKAKPGKRITTKAVQAIADKPYVPPAVPIKPVEDSDAWGDDALTFKQRRFCEFYVGEAAGNSTLAAQLAGYRDDNRIALASTGSENLRKPQIRSYIGRLLSRQGMTVDFLKSRLSELASASLNNFTTMDAAGEVFTDLKTGAALGAIGQLKEIKEKVLKVSGETSVIERTIKCHDPLPAIRTLLEMQGALKQTVEHTGSIKHEHEVQPLMAKLRENPEAMRQAMALADRLGVDDADSDVTRN